MSANIKQLTTEELQKRLEELETQFYKKLGKGSSSVHSNVGEFNLLRVPGSFGGDGSDGDLSISSGTTTLDFNSEPVLVKNYKSVHITGTAKIAFSNPADNGSIFVMKSQGPVVISSTQPAIDLRSMGATAGNDGNALVSKSNNGVAGIDATSGSGTNVGSDGGSGNGRTYFQESKLIRCSSGAGGGAGGAAQGGGNAGTGGRGGGGLLVECKDTLNFSGTINASGANGGNGGGNAGGGGGGGAAGTILILYGTLVANSGTFTSTGGDGGDGADGDHGSNNAGGGGTGGTGGDDTGGASGGTGGNSIATGGPDRGGSGGGGGGSDVGGANGGNGGNSNTASGGSGSAGGGGGGGGAGGFILVEQNTNFV